MALVRISRNLISDVRNCVQHLRNGEVGEISAPSTTITPTDAHIQSLSAFFWGEHAHLRHQMPADWCRIAKTVNVATVHRHDDGQYETTSQVSFHDPNRPITVPPETPLGFGNGHYSAASQNISYDIIEEAALDPDHMHHCVAAPVYAVVQYEQALRKVRKSWMAREAQIVQFLEKCKSLNEAIKLWPQVKLYVPKSYIDTVETAVVRPQPVARKEKVLADVNTDDLTAAAIAAKLQGFL